MNELIKIEDHNGQKLVNARELHEFLGSKQEFTHWIKQRIEKYGFIENQDYISFDNIIKRETGATKRIEYHLTINMSKEVSMVENNERGKQARRYFLKMEEIAKTKSIALPTKRELAQMVIEAEDKIEALEQDNKLKEQIVVNQNLQLRRQEPKVNYADSVSKSPNSIKIGTFAKYLSSHLNFQVGQNRLFDWLRKRKILMTGRYKNDPKHNEPYQRYVDLGIFTPNETHVENENGSFTRNTWRVTAKGRIYLLDLYIKDHKVKPDLKLAI